MSVAKESPGLRKELRLLLRRGRQVWALVPWRHRGVLGIAAVLMAVTSGANTAVALMLGSLVDQIKTGIQEDQRTELYRSVGWILGTLAVIYAVRELLHVLRRALVESSCTRINRDMQLRTVGHTLKTDLVSLATEKVGSLHGRIFRSVDGLVRFVRLMFLDCLPALFTGLFALGAALSKQPVLGLVMLGVVPLSVVLTMRQLKSQKGIRLKLMRDCEEIDGMVVEQLNGAEYIRVADTFPLEMRRLTRSADKRRQREVRHHFEMSLYGCAKALNEGFFHIAVLALASYLAINGKISFGDVLTFSVLYLNVMTPLNEVHRIIDEGHEACLRVGDLVQLLLEPTDAAFKGTTTPSINLKTGDTVLQTEDLLVSYLTPEGTLRQALDHISLTIRHGETIGVAGRSGSGKSTWVKVLLRLLHPDRGNVDMGGHPLESIDRTSLARLVGYVGQTPFVFSGTIAENIAYGNGDVSLEQIQHAAELANLHDEILEMPGGYAAEITERGQNLSGGQRQRLALARILLKRPPILILDEATSALDNISERHIQRSLGITSSDRTTILIAHRLTTLKDCDRILVFDEGRIVQVGTYEELLETNGVFAELVHSAECSVDEEIPTMSPPVLPTPAPAVTRAG